MRGLHTNTKSSGGGGGGSTSGSGSGSGSNVGGSGSPSSGGGGSGSGGTGLMNTLKKLKGKKKKQRNLTAPEITSQDLRDAVMSDDSYGGSTATLETLREDRGGGGEKKGKGLFGKKAKEKQVTDSPKQRNRNTLDMSEIVYRNERAGDQSPLHTEQSILRDSMVLSANDLTPPAEVEVSLTISSDINADPKPIVLEPLDLSQVSEKHSGGTPLSQSAMFSGSNEEHYSTQSSTDGVRLSADSELTQQEVDNNQQQQWDRIPDKPYLLGSSKLYKEFGSKQHRLNLERVFEFLESSGETEPADLSVLHDWDGWMVASKDIV